MKYCPVCKRRFDEAWLSFCSDDGTPLIQELTPPADPNWDPRIRELKVKTQDEQETQWLPREPPLPGGWIAPDERPPMSPGACCLLYTSDAADERSSVDLGGRRIIKKKKKNY